MASSKEYLDFILEQLSDLEEITYRAMMGEYIIYYRGKIVGGIYDDRFLVKPVKSAIEYMENAKYELPYDGAKEMLLVDDVDNKEFLTGLVNAMYDELPAPKPKKKKQLNPSLVELGHYNLWRRYFMEDKQILLNNIDEIYTTEMGVIRIKKNLKLDTEDVVEYCKDKVLDKNCNIYKQGKNWYCEIDNIKITINSYSYTIITAHMIK